MTARQVSTGFTILMGLGAHADPGFVTGGGQPQIVSGVTTVRMTSEKVTLEVLADRVQVDGDYEFDNLGGACNIHVGFPETASFGLGKTIPSVLAHYHTYVDGVLATSKLMPGKNPSEQFHVQTMSFPSKGHRSLHITYVTSIGGFAGKPPLALTEYILHTGGSWNGPIGSIVVDVKFTKGAELGKTLDVWHKGAANLTESLWQTQPAKPGGVIAVGPGDVTVLDDTIRFTAKNFKPSAKDDILIIFRYPPKELKKVMKPGATTPVVPPG